MPCHSRKHFRFVLLGHNDIAMRTGSSANLVPTKWSTTALEEEPCSCLLLKRAYRVVYNFEASKISNHRLLSGEQYMEFATALKKDCQRLLEVTLLDEVVTFIKQEDDAINTFCQAP